MNDFEDVPTWTTKEQTYDAEGRAQIETSAPNMDIRMTQGGDLNGNSAWFELEIEAAQPVTVSTNAKGNAVIRVTGTQEAWEIAEFFGQYIGVIGRASKPDESF